jgi:hypothetical protein
MKTIGRFLTVLLLGGVLVSGAAVSPAAAALVSLDGVANAGWSTDDLTRTHLYIYDLTAGAYAYQWWYGVSGPLPWSSVQDLVNDLSDNVLNNAGGIPVGDWKVESGGDAFNQPAAVIWKSVSLAAGTYSLYLTADSRAYDIKDYVWPNETVDHIWNCYVQILADYVSSTESFNFGDWDDRQPTEAEALDYYRANVDGTTITLTADAVVYFFINDYNSVDNAGSVTLEILPIPLPGTLSLLALGLAALGLLDIRRRW